MSAGVPVLPGHRAPGEPWGPDWPPEWRQQAACRNGDPDAFFPPDGRNSRARARAEERARLTCATCPVRRPCLAVALLRQEEHGVWGGLTTDERHTLKAPRSLSPDEAIALADRALRTPLVARGS